MNFKCLVLSVAVVALAGCGKAPVSANSASGNPSTPPSSNLTVTSPTAGAAVSSPFVVSASASECQSQSISSIGYSLDQGTATQITGAALQAQVAATAGAHTLHVLAWGADGSSCTSDVAITVSSTPATTTTGPSIPSNAITVSEIQQLPNWKSEFDTATSSGGSTGVMTLVDSPSLSGSALQFATSFTNNGGERYHVTFGSDPLATHFVYDAQVYLAAPASSIANIEMDMNQVLANGNTVIYGFQCDGYSSTWDISENTGTPAAPVDHWIHTAAALQPAAVDHRQMAPRAGRLLPRRRRQRHLAIRLVRRHRAAPQPDRPIRVRFGLVLRPAHQLPDRRPRQLRLQHRLRRQPHCLALVDRVQVSGFRVQRSAVARLRRELTS